MHLTRRRALHTGAMLATAALAGCASSSASNSSPTATPTPTSASASTTAPASSDSEAAPGAKRENEQASELPRARRATLRTTRGDITVELYPDRVPVTVGNFVALASGELAWRDPETGEIRTDPLYEDILFHRVIDDFMIQCGDPTGTGRGGPGYTFEDEFHDDLRHDRPGILSMANRGPDTNGSQFFITLEATPHLDGRHAVFGAVVDGMNVVREIGSVPTDGNDRPREPVVLESVEVGDGAGA